MEVLFGDLYELNKWLSNIIFGLATIVVYKFFYIFNRFIKVQSRSRKLNKLVVLRKKRQNPMEVTALISSANAHYITFLLMCFFFLGSSLYPLR